MYMTSMQPMLKELINDPNTPRCIAELVSRLLSDTTQLVQVKELPPQALKALQTLINMINSLPRAAMEKFYTRNYYIGSASNTVNQLGQHRDCLFGNRPKESVHIRLLESFNASDLTWSLFYTMTNYSKTALSVLPSSYELSFGEIQILRAITEIAPSLNHILNPVVFTYNIWDPSVYDYATDGSHAVQIISAETGEILPHKSSARTRGYAYKIEKGASAGAANRYLNKDYGFFSDVFGSRIILSVIGMTLITKKIEHRKAVNYPTLTLPGGSLSDLAPYLVWAFKANKVDLRVVIKSKIGATPSPFVNYTQAFRTLEPSKITNNPNSSLRVSTAYLTLLNGLLTSMYFDNMNLVSSILLLIRAKPPPYGSNPSSRKSPLYGKPIADKPFSK
ncbi:uncharacterized protein UDID_18248 [Ustilago sp. UG-2017a]|nr:uncharacterized protein UDID_18248 [Ustilago sp. UG-2017a]